MIGVCLVLGCECDWTADTLSGMKIKESRRIVPISMVTLVALGVLFVFEMMVMLGAVNLKASFVAKVAPWAYEPFLRLVGEHPDSYSRRNSAGTDDDSWTENSGADADALFSTDIMSADTNAAPAEAAGADLPEIRSEDADDDVPVG